MRYAAKPLIIEAVIWSGNPDRLPEWLEHDPSFRYDCNTGALYWYHETGTYTKVDIGAYLVQDSGTGATFTYVISAEIFRKAYEPVAPFSHAIRHEAPLHSLWAAVQVYAAQAELLAALNQRIDGGPDWEFAKLAARADVERAWMALKTQLANLERASHATE